MRFPRREAPVGLALACFVLAAAAAIGCGGGDGGNDSVIVPASTASFAASGTLAAPNLVWLNQVSASGNLVVLEVVLGGPTTSSDLYSFAFDLVLGNAGVVQYVPGSAEVGDSLTTSGGQTLAVEASQSGGRVVVGVTKLGGGAGNGVAGAQAGVVQLTFKALTVGTSTISFSGSTALDSVGDPIGSIVFDAVPAAISGS